ncbi:RIP metalloprotease RseP [Candidatus Parcubacteria bacterium]|nr:RIP metalloprotease RseP [Candidatus Parcubacteria bacterium]
MARRFGVKCDEFGLGFPPRMIGFVKDPERPLGPELEAEGAKRAEGSGVLGFFKQWKIVKRKNKDARGNEKEYKNTIYSLNWIPLGGFVKIKGEQGEEAKDEDSFAHQKLWKRAIILSSGVTMNFIFATLLLSIGFIIGIPQVIDEITPKYASVKDEKIQLLSIQKDSPAKQVGLEVGDIVVSIDNQKFKEIEDVQKYIQEDDDGEIIVTVKRAGEEIEQTVTSEVMEIEGGQSKKAIGVVLAKTGTVSYPFFQAIWQGIITTLYLMKLIVLSFYHLFKDLIVMHKVTIDIAGPVGIAVVTGQVVRLGFIYILQFAALLSINLGIINFFPFPALDGGRVVALGIEAVRRKPNNQRIEAVIHNIGFGVLMVLVVLVTYRDVVRFGGKLMGKIFGYFDDVVS